MELRPYNTYSHFFFKFSSSKIITKFQSRSVQVQDELPKNGTVNRQLSAKLVFMVLRMPVHKT